RHLVAAGGQVRADLVAAPALRGDGERADDLAIDAHGHDRSARALIAARANVEAAAGRKGLGDARRRVACEPQGPAGAGGRVAHDADARARARHALGLERADRRGGAPLRAVLPLLLPLLGDGLALGRTLVRLRDTTLLSGLLGDRVGRSLCDADKRQCHHSGQEPADQTEGLGGHEGLPLWRTAIRAAAIREGVAVALEGASEGALARLRTA